MIYAQIKTQAEQARLDAALKASKDKQWYRRLQIIALSAKKYTVGQLSQMFDLCQATIRSYIKAYNQGGLEGLKVKPRSGCPPKIGHWTKADWDRVLARARPASPPARFDQGVKEILRTGIPVDQLLGVPLDADGKGVLRDLQRLDEAVRRAGDHSQPRGDILDGLVVQAIDRKGCCAQDAGQARTGCDGGRVGQEIARAAVVFDVLRAPGNLRRDIGQLDPRDIWVAIVLGHMTRVTLSLGRFRQGKWRDIKVEIGTSR